MQIERIEELRLTADDEAQIGQLLDAAYGDLDQRSYYAQRHHLRLVTRHDSKIVGHLALTFRAVRLGPLLVDIVGIADVATLPAFRRAGIATALTKASIEQAHGSLANFAVLFGDERFYAACGFVPKPNPMRFVDLQDVRTGQVREVASKGLMVLPLREVVWDDAALLDLVGHAF